jgi:hypothetical protein
VIAPSPIGAVLREQAHARFGRCPGSDLSFRAPLRSIVPGVPYVCAHHRPDTSRQHTW